MPVGWLCRGGLVGCGFALVSGDSLVEFLGIIARLGEGFVGFVVAIRREAVMSRGLWVPVVSGPLESYAAGYRSWLLERGYAGRTVVNRLELLGLLSRWLEREGLACSELTAEQTERFLASRRVSGYSRCASATSRSLPVGYLRELGVVPAALPVVSAGPVERLLEGYRRYLFEERGLGERFVLESYVPTARLFLSDRQGSDGELMLGDLNAADVSSFLAVECRKRGVDSTRNMAGGLRCLLRYLRMAGLIGVPLEWAVPGVADLRDRSLPRGIERTAVTQLLAVCDTQRTVGQRNYAIVLLLWRLGLRAGEVAAVTLDDIDWHAGEILVRGP